MHVESLIEKAIADYISANGHSEMLAPASYLIRLGGKRVRPLAVLLSHQLFSDDIEAALHPALAIEIFHNFTLMHDDIMDKSPLRRGEPTVHEKWDANTAILSGDAMMIQAYQYLVRTRPDTLAPLMECFNTTALEVCEGQQQDMSFEKRHDVSVDEYLEMIRLKTSVLLAAACKVGAITGNASAEDQQALYSFGLNLGLQFQLWDDYLDTFGDQAKVGKEIGTDILNDKKTMLRIRTYATCSDAERAELDALRGYPTDAAAKTHKVERVRDIMRRSGVIEETEQRCDDYYQKALQHLDSVSVNEERKTALRAVAAKLYKRTH